MMERGDRDHRGDRDGERPKRKKRLMSRKKRTLDPSIVVDYKQPDVLKRFITDRGKIIPRRISGATAAQQRQICTAIKRARYLGLIPYSIAHRTEKGFSGDMAAATVFAASRDARRSFSDRPPMDNQNRSDAPAPRERSNTEEGGEE